MPKSVVSIDSSVHPANDRSDDEYEDSDSDDEEYALAQKEWEESMQQLSQVFSIILLPYFGKWLGRRYAHQAYSRYLMYGFGKAFFLGGRPPMRA